MKKLRLLVLTGLLMALGMTAKADEQELYTVYSNGTLTYHHDSYRSSQTGEVELWEPGKDQVRFRNYADKVKKVEILAHVCDWSPTSLKHMFYGGSENGKVYALSNLETIEGLQYLNTENVKDMCGMFLNCRSLKSVDVRFFNTAKVEDMSAMFEGCQSLKEIDIAGFHFAKVVRVQRMFCDCQNLVTIYCNESMVTDAPKLKVSTAMFYNCFKIKGQLGTPYDPAQTGYLRAHFDLKNGESQTDQGYFTYKKEVYREYSLGETLGTMTYYYDTQRSKRTNTVEFYDPELYHLIVVFYGSYDPTFREKINLIRLDPSMADVSLNSGKCMFCWRWKDWLPLGFHNVIKIQGLQYLNTANMHDMSFMFDGLASLTELDITNFQTWNVTNMEHMFYECVKLTELDLTHFNFDKVTSVNKMFQECKALKTIKCNVDLSGRTDALSAGMFSYCTSLVGGQGTAYQDSKTDISYARPDGGTASPGYFTGEGKKVYTAYKDGKLTFYYDDRYQLREDAGYIIDDYKPEGDLKRFVNYHTQVTAAYFDKSMQDAPLTSLRNMFYGGQNGSTAHYNLSNLNAITGWENLNTSNVESYEGMFQYCTKLSDFDFSKISLDKATNFEYMFYYCSGLYYINCNVDLSTIASAHGGYMFTGCEKLSGGEGSKYNASYTGLNRARPDGGTARPGYFSASNEVYTEYKSSTHELIYYYDALRTTRYGVTEAYNPSAIRFKDYHEDVTKVIITPSMKNRTLSSMRRLFNGGYANGKHYALKNVTTIEGMENLNTSQTTDMSYMFLNCEKLTAIDLKGFNTEKVTDMGYMFSDCRALTELDLTGFNMSGVENASGMFSNCKALTTIHCGENWSKYSQMKHSAEMFLGCTSLVGGINTYYSESYKTDKTLARVDEGRYGDNRGYFTDVKRVYSAYDEDTKTLTFYYDSHFEAMRNQYETVNWEDPIYGMVGYPCVEKYGEKYRFAAYAKDVKTIVIDPSMKDAALTSMKGLFYGGVRVSDDVLLENVTSITGIDNLNTSQVKNMSQMFRGLHSLKNLNLSSFYTADVTDMSEMFSFCESLTEIDLTSFNVSNVKDMSHMFLMCSKLRTIYSTKDWAEDAKDATSLRMFYGCTNLEGSAGTKFNEANMDINRARMDGLNYKLGYFSGKTEIYTVYDASTQTLTYKYNAYRSVETKPTEVYDPVGNPYAVRFQDYSTSIKKIVIDASMADAPLKSTVYMFYGGFDGNTFKAYPLKNVTEITGLKYLNTAEVTTMQGMFMGCGVQYLNLSLFDMNKVKDVSYMFTDCSNLEAVMCVGDWKMLKNLKASDDMFSGCDNLQGGKGTAYSSANPTDMTYANTDGFNEKPGYFTALTLCYTVFDEEAETLTYYYDQNYISRPGVVEFYDEENPATERFKGYNDKVKTIVISSSMQIAALTTAANLFYGGANTPLSNVTSIQGVINLMYATVDVTDMSYMFAGMKSLKSVNISKWYMDKVTKTISMFDGCEALESIYCKKDFTSLTSANSQNMFRGCSSLKGSAGTTYASTYGAYVDRKYARLDGGTSTPGFFSSDPELYWVHQSSDKSLTYYYDSQYESRTGTAKGKWELYDAMFTSIAANVRTAYLDESVKNYETVDVLAYLFVGLSNLKEIHNLDYLHTENVYDMQHMFDGCSNLESINVSSFNTEKVKNMNGMFKGCASLTTLNLYNFSIASLGSCANMFNGCSELTTIYWNASLASSTLITDSRSTDMFAGCVKLKGELLEAKNYIDTEEGRNRSHASKNSFNGYFRGVNELYTVFDESTETLTYYYDAQRDQRTGVVEMYDFKNPLKPRFKGYAKKVKYIYIHGSMKNHGFPTMAYLFYGASDSPLEDNTLSNVTQITPIGDLPIDNTASLAGMFKGMTSLTRFILPGYVRKVKDMTSMFEGCESLDSIALWRFNEDMVVEKMDNMFKGCKTLKTIACQYDWTKIASLQSSTDMFAGCEALVGGGGTEYASYATDVQRAHPDGNMMNPGYFYTTYKVTLSATTNGTIAIEEDVTLNQVPSGTILTVVVTPDEGYELDTYSGFEPGKGLLVTEATTISATFKRQQFTVNFYDKDGSFIETRNVYYGEDATAPNPKQYTGYDFIGWDNSFTNVKENIEVHAIFQLKTFTVKFYDENNQVIDEQIVCYGDNAIEPEIPEREGYDFKGWDVQFDVVTGDIKVLPLYTIKTFTVRFLDFDETVLKTETVEYGKAATAPADPTRTGYKFTGWDKPFTNITADLDVTALYELIEGIENVQSTETIVVKILRNGQVFIIRDGVMYNILGGKIQ